jgi:hypothetical protein
MRLPWIWVPFLGPIRVSTLIVGALMVIAIVWRRRDALIALTALMGWLSTFEILYQATGAALHGWSLSYVLWMSAALGGWVVLSAVRRIVPDWRLLLPMALVWALWILTGFNSNSPSIVGTPGFPPDFSAGDELFNELSKTLLAVAFLVGALKPQARVPL